MVMSVCYFNSRYELQDPVLGGYNAKSTAQIRIHAHQEDTEDYLEYRIAAEPRLSRHLEADTSLWETIMRTTIEKVDGMFLLARLYMDSLARKKTRRDLRHAIENLPAEIDDVYTEALQGIEGQDYEDQGLVTQVL